MKKSYYVRKGDKLYSFNDAGGYTITIRLFNLMGSDATTLLSRADANSFWRDKRKMGYLKLGLGSELQDFLIKWKIKSKDDKGPVPALDISSIRIRPTR